jgi:tetratricopeptide (TPR) repeat protein
MKKKDFTEAINYQKKALSVYAELENAEPKKIANVAITLSEWSEKAENIPEAIDSLRQAQQIYEYAFGVMDKKTCKIKRNISLLLLKANTYDQALEELIEVEVINYSYYF